MFRSVCVNEEIIKEGLAKATPIEDLSNDAVYNRLSDKLSKAEAYAEKKGKGIWTRPSWGQRVKELPRNIRTNISSYFSDRFTIFTSKFKRNS